MGGILPITSGEEGKTTGKDEDLIHTYIGGSGDESNLESDENDSERSFSDSEGSN